MKKKILVSVDAGETRVAVLEAKGTARAGDEPQGRRPERRPATATAAVRTGGSASSTSSASGSQSIVGNIYKGVVDNVLPGMEAAFVDIGLERNGFLHVDEIVTPDGKAVPKRGRGQGRRIDELIQRGQEIVVQAVKDPLKTKGARLTMQLSIAGRYLVYMPQGGGDRRQPPAARQRAQRRCARALEKLHDPKRGQGRLHRPHRRAGRQEGGLRARDPLPAQAPRGARAALRGRRGAVAGLPGGGPARSACCATCSAASSTAPRSTTSSSSSG